MSIHLMSLVWERAPYDGGTLLALLALADWANEEGITWPSVAQIAQKARMQVRNAQYILRTLEADGMLTREQAGKGRSTTVYRINLVKLNALPVVWHRPHATPPVPGREQKEITEDFAPMQNLQDAAQCTSAMQPSAPLPCNDCTSAMQPSAPQGCNPVHPIRQRSVKEPSPSPTPPGDTGGGDFSLSLGAGKDPFSPTHPPTPLASPPAQDVVQEPESVPEALTRDDIRAFMATIWREVALEEAINGQPHAPPGALGGGPAP